MVPVRPMCAIQSQRTINTGGMPPRRNTRATPNATVAEESSRPLTRASRAAARARALREKEERATATAEETENKDKVPAKSSPPKSRSRATGQKRTRAQNKKDEIEKEEEEAKGDEEHREDGEGFQDDENPSKKRKVVVVDYMKHASQKTKQRRATSTARKEQVGVDRQIQMSEDMRAMINADADGGGGEDDVSCTIDEALMPYVIEDSSSAASGMDTATDDSDVNPTDAPAAYLRKRFANDARRRKRTQRDQRQRSGLRRAPPLYDKPGFLSARPQPPPSPLPPTMDDVTDDPILQEPPPPLPPIEGVDNEYDNDDEKVDAPHPLMESACARSSLVRITGSDELKPRDYSAYVDHRFKDTQFETDMLGEKDLVKKLCNHYAAQEHMSLEEAEKALESRGYGKRAITMESFDIRKQTYGKSNYPTSTRVRCRYDHQTFKGIPILIPIKYYEDRNILTVFPNIAFCSFSCALAWLEREAPPVVRRRDRVQMLQFTARHFFGLNERIRPAPFLEQHVDYGGRLTTEQWRSLSQTHCSFIQYPLAVSVPCTIITEVTIQKRLDREILARIAKRTEEAHAQSAPEKPDYGHPDAKDAYKRGQKEGKGRPIKRRTMKDERGDMVALDKSFLDKVVKKARVDSDAKPRATTGIQALMGIKKIKTAK